MATDTGIPLGHVAETLAHSNLVHVFSQRDATLRLEAIKKTYHPDVQFAEPDGRVCIGHDALNKKACSVLEEHPGWGFVPKGNVKQTREMVYLAWGFGPLDEGGELARAQGRVDVQVTGADVLIVEEGLIRRFWVIVDGMSDV